MTFHRYGLSTCEHQKRRRNEYKKGMGTKRMKRNGIKKREVQKSEWGLLAWITPHTHHDNVSSLLGFQHG